MSWDTPSEWLVLWSLGWFSWAVEVHGTVDAVATQEDEVCSLIEASMNRGKQSSQSWRRSWWFEYANKQVLPPALSFGFATRFGEFGRTKVRISEASIASVAFTLLRWGALASTISGKAEGRHG